MWLEVATYYAGLLLACCAATFCLSSGLYAAAEWLEDHLRSTKRCLRRGIQASAALQLAWLLLDWRVALPNVLGLASHASSWVMLQQHYPHHMGLDQAATYVSVALLLAHQTAWMLSELGRASEVWQVLCVLCVVVWPLPILLILSAGAEPDLPVVGVGSMDSAAAAAAAAAAGSCSSSLPGSPMAGAAAAASSVAVALQRKALHHRHLAAGGTHAHPLLPTDTAHQGDQADGAASGSVLPGHSLLHSLHMRKASAGSCSSDGGGGSSSGGGCGSPWAVAEALHLQQQQGQQGHHHRRGGKQHRSRVVKAMDGVWELLGRHGASLLPITRSVPYGLSAAAAGGGGFGGVGRGVGSQRPGMKQRVA